MKEFNISSSNGTFKKLEYERRKGIGDHTPILKLVSEYESQGYKLLGYTSGGISNLEATAFLSK